ncbi:hypothetical protein DYB37_006331 [Aphanomyces astaci]|nr:hypothetical protein DYB35_006913 [Aphanomyces astaci]RHZ14133.1 hypothetical protein DYB37_006331 [Aphanomyces astaci]
MSFNPALLQDVAAVASTCPNEHSTPALASPVVPRLGGVLTEKLQASILTQSNLKAFDKVVKTVDDLLAKQVTINDVVWSRYLQALNHLSQFDETVARFETLLAEYGTSMWRHDRMYLVHAALFAAKNLRRGDLALTLVQESHRHGALYLQNRHYFDALWANSIVLVAGKGNTHLPRYTYHALPNALAIAHLAAKDGFCLPPFVWLELIEACVRHNHPSETILALTGLMASHTPLVLPNARTLQRALAAPTHARRHELSMQMLRQWIPHLSRYAPQDASRICETVLKPLCRLGMASRPLPRSADAATPKGSHGADVTELSQANALILVSEIVDTMVRHDLRFHPYVLTEYYLPVAVPSLSAPLFLAHVGSCGPHTLVLNAYVLQVALREYTSRGQVEDVQCLLQAALDHEIEVTWTSMESILNMFARVGAFDAATSLVESILNDTASDTEVRSTDEMPLFLYRHAMHAYMESNRLEEADAFFKRHLETRQDEFGKAMALVAAAARRLRERAVVPSLPEVKDQKRPKDKQLQPPRA